MAKQAGESAILHPHRTSAVTHPWLVSFDDFAPPKGGREGLGAPTASGGVIIRLKSFVSDAMCGQERVPV